METTRDIRGVNVNPKGREPRKLGRMEGSGTAPWAHPETIQESKYGCGLPRHGTDLAKVSDPDRRGYADGKAYREAHRSSPYPGK